MTDRFEQQSQSLVDYAEPPTEPLKAHSLEQTDPSATNPDDDLGETLSEHNAGDLMGPATGPIIDAEAEEKAFTPFGVRTAVPDRPA